LFSFSVGSENELYSYILLIPFVSAYLAWLQPPGFSATRPPARLAGGALLFAGLLAFLCAHFWTGPAVETVLDLKVLSLICALAGICACFLGWDQFRRLAFPLGLLIFMLPIPPALRSGIDSFLQSGSAAAANGLFSLSGVPVWQDGVSFRLPDDIRFNVEPECSGIHSTLVLLITSLVAGHLLLRTRWKQVLLVAVVIPLALLRNGFRIYVLGQLCVHYGARMFDSWVHHRGGPLFFILSLIPFFGLLIWLIKTEPRGGPPGKKVVATQNI